MGRVAHGYNFVFKGETDIHQSETVLPGRLQGHRVIGSGQEIQPTNPVAPAPIVNLQYLFLP
jgi:hypothetical protein